MQLVDIQKKIYQITEKTDMEQALNKLVDEYFSLKIFYIRQEILHYEYKWNMTYTEFEKKSTEMGNGFSFEIEKEYYDWGEKVALLEYYQKFKNEWV
jgi:hypothetical protein